MSCHQMAFQKHSVSTPEDVDGYVLWAKNNECKRILQQTAYNEGYILVWGDK